VYINERDAHASSREREKKIRKPLFYTLPAVACVCACMWTHAPAWLLFTRVYTTDTSIYIHIYIYMCMYICIHRSSIHTYVYIRPSPCRYLGQCLPRQWQFRSTVWRGASVISSVLYASYFRHQEIPSRWLWCIFEKPFGIEHDSLLFYEISARLLLNGLHLMKILRQR